MPLEDNYIAELRAAIMDLRSLVYRELKLRAELHDKQHLEEEKALNVARASMEHRLNGMNEFREQLNDQTRQFVSREQVDLMREHTAQRLRDIETAQAQLAGRLWAIGTILTLGIAVVAIVMGFF